MVYGSGTDSGKERKEPETHRFRGVRLVVCLWVVFLVCFAKLAFPEKIDAAMDDIMLVLRGNADFDSAISVFGEAAAGEKSLIDALNEACYYAFTIVPNTVEVIDETDDLSVPAGNSEPDTDSNNTGNANSGDGAEQSGIEDVNIDADADVLTSDSDTKQVETGADTKDGDTELAGQSGESPDSIDTYDDRTPEGSSTPDNVTFKRVELNTNYTVPADGAITSHFGYREDPNGGGLRFHYGIDIGAAKGSEVCAFSDGVIQSVADSASYGLYVTIEHDGIRTLYAHLDSALVNAGDTVSAGDIIALSGDSGNATGACLHFELMVDGVYVDPEFYVAL